MILKPLLVSICCHAGSGIDNRPLGIVQALWYFPSKEFFFIYDIWAAIKFWNWILWRTICYHLRDEVPDTYILFTLNISLNGCHDEILATPCSHLSQLILYLFLHQYFMNSHSKIHNHYKFYWKHSWIHLSFCV